MGESGLPGLGESGLDGLDESGLGGLGVSGLSELGEGGLGGLRESGLLPRLSEGGPGEGGPGEGGLGELGAGGLGELGAGGLGELGAGGLGELGESTIGHARRVVLGIDFGGTKTAVAVCDPAGRRLGYVVTGSLGERGAQVSFEHGVRTARALLEQTAPGADLAAVGVATFGIPFEDRVELAPTIPGWGQLALGAELRAAFPGSAVAMATDTKAAGEAEARWGSLAGCDTAVYVNLGTGLAAAIVTGGRVLAGNDGAAGEIGYSLRSRRDVGVPADRRVCLEDAVSGMGLRRRASRTGGVTAAEVFAGAAAGEPRMTDLVCEFLDELAFHIVNITIAVNPARVCFGGGLTRSWDLIQPRIAEALQHGVPYPPELALAAFPDDAALLGAVALAVRAAGAADASAVHLAQPPEGWHRDRQRREQPEALLAGSERP